MTIAGINVIDPRRAVIWCDAEIYHNTAPVGIANKMATNPLAGIVGVGAGTMLLLHEAAAVIQRAIDLEDAVAHLPGVLRGVRRAFAETPATRAVAGRGQYAVAGLCDRLGRVLIYAFRAWEEFSPMLVGAWAHPACPYAHVAVDAHGAIAVAHEQIAAFRAEVPGATGGRLVVAEINGSAISARVLDVFKSAPPVEGPAGAGAGGVGEATYPASAHMGAKPHGI